MFVSRRPVVSDTVTSSKRDYAPTVVAARDGGNALIIAEGLRSSDKLHVTFDSTSGKSTYQMGERRSAYIAGLRSLRNMAGAILIRMTEGDL